MSLAQREPSAPKVTFHKKEKAASSAPELTSPPVVVGVTKVTPQLTEEQIVAERELTRQKKTADYERRKQLTKQDHRVSENEQEQPRQTPPQRNPKRSGQGRSPVDGNEFTQPQPQPQSQQQQRQDLKPKKNEVQSHSPQSQSPAPAKEQSQSVKNIQQNNVQHEQKLRTEADITLAQWSVDDVVGWLNSIGSGSLAKNFTRNHVSGDILPYITFDDLKTEFEISSFGHRVQLYNKLTELLKSYGEKRVDLRRPSKKSQQKKSHQEAPPPIEPAHNNNTNGNYDEESYQEEQPKQHQRKHKRRYKNNFNHGYTQQQHN